MISPAELRRAAHAVRNAADHAKNAKAEMERAALILGDHVADFLEADLLEELTLATSDLVVASEAIDVAASAGGLP